MIVEPIGDAAAIPAQALFPSWRGLKPYGEHLDAVSGRLYAAHPGLADAVAACPFELFESADRLESRVRSYHEVPAAAAALVAALPDALRAPWLCALLAWHIRRFGPVFAATGLDDEFAFHYADAFHRILDQIDEDTGFANLASDCFRKDLWLARVVMIPAFAQVWWPHSGLSARIVLRAGPAAAAHVFWRCGGRRRFLEGHTHNPVARAYWNEAGWGEALRLAALALLALPGVRGAFGGAWFYDPAIMEVSPRIRFAQDLQLGRGAHRIRIGSNAEAIKNATATSAERRNRYQEGRYLPTDYALIWSRRDLLAAYGN